MISLRYVEHVLDRSQPVSRSRYGRQQSANDILGATLNARCEVDITNAADLVTVSWNRLLNHDKTMLIGFIRQRHDRPPATAASCA